MTRHLIDFVELDLEIELAIEYGPVPCTRRVMILGCACVSQAQRESCLCSCACDRTRCVRVRRLC